MNNMAATYPKFNIELHNKIIEQIENHPETWDQTKWHCGTKHCYAGWAQVLSGNKEDNYTVLLDAGNALGLTTDAMLLAFCPGNTLEDLKRLPETIAAYCRFP